jgi:hypothetical protein
MFCHHIEVGNGAASADPVTAIVLPPPKRMKNQAIAGLLTAKTGGRGLHKSSLPLVTLSPPSAALAVSPSPIVTLPRAKPARRPVALTPITLRIEALIQRLATACHPMSSNVILAGVLNGPGRETVRRSIERLVLAKRITVETKPGMRRVCVCATGQTTDWGVFVTTGHAPFSLNARGTVPVKAPRPDYQPVEGEVFRHRIAPQKLVETKPAPGCQWTLETGNYCDAPSVPGYSWCLCHGRIIFPSWDRSPPKPRR